MSQYIISEKIQGLHGKFGHITLNRPLALNALNLEMIIALDKILEEWEKDPTVLAVILQSSSEKAFCAGGDIRAVYDAGLKNDPISYEFFEREYKLNRRIHHYTKPYISFMNGINMGGGVGISLHGSHKIAGNNFKFAMPETTIGFFPDIGGAYLLNRCPGAYGVYLGLTGARLEREDALALKLINYCINTDKQLYTIEKLHDLDLRINAKEKVSHLLKMHHQENLTDHLSVLEKSSWINHVFSKESMEDIMNVLQKLQKSTSFTDTEQFFIQKTYLDLKKKSPISLKVTLEMLKHTKNQNYTFDDCINVNAILVKHFLQDKDFYEGIRALIVDKDHQPQWNPARLEDISEEQIINYFLQ